MALRGLPPALNNVNVGRKVNEKPFGVTQRAALGDIANTRVAVRTGGTKAIKTLKKVEEAKPVKKLVKPSNETQKLSQQLDKLKLKEAFSAQQLAEVENIDEGDENQPQLVSEWVNEIYDYLRLLESRFVIRPNYLDGNTIIKPRMRVILVDWLIQVHTRFGLLQETLYLTVAILDRVLQDLELPRSKLQLLGITSMFIASKYEEMYAPEIADFVYICDNTYSKKDIRQMECVILQQLDFGLGRPLPLHFLRRNSKAGNATSSLHTMAKYLMELTLMDYDMVHYAPSHIAAAALCLSLKLLKDSCWTETLVYYSKYGEKELTPVMEKMALLVEEAVTSKFQTIRSKYAHEKFGSVSHSKYLQTDLIKELASAAKSKSKSD